jgi:hypothetical protein
LLFLVVNLGLGFGPLLVGVLSDQLTPAYGNDALGHALFLSCSTFLIGVAIVCKVARTVTHDIAEADGAVPAS